MTPGHRPLPLRVLSLAHRALHRVTGGRVGSLDPGKQAPRGRALELITAVHRRVYRWTGGLVGANAGGLPTLLLTSTGWKTGAKRTVPLPYFTDGERLVVVASFSGNASDPAWYKNLSASPNATAQVGFHTKRVAAHAAAGEERKRLWAKIVDEAPMYADYQRTTAREIPVVVLTPTG